ncbi:MAG: SecD/SecF fusion protein [Planctomycetota bacterium]|jgi:SecD/SecF fusion protein
MLEDISRKVTILLSLLVATAISWAVLGLNLGLDLQGGTRLVYSIDIDRALEDGSITESEAANPSKLKSDVISIWTKRIDPQGVRNVVVRSEGTNQISIEIPGSASAVRSKVSAPLLEAIDEESIRIELDALLPKVDGQEPRASELADLFPSSGGVIEIGGERMRYSRRQGYVLREVERGYDGTGAKTHAKGDSILLKASDPWRDLIENVGDMHFFIEATGNDLRDASNPALSTDLPGETDAMRAWLTANPGIGIQSYNDELAQREGPASRLRFYPMASDNPDATLESLMQALIIQENENWRFDGDDMQAFYPSTDDLGLPAVGFIAKGESQTHFGDFTEEHEQERMAIVINDVVATFPNISERLPGRGIINGGAGGFTFEEVNELIEVLRSGSLKIRPDFESQETVGATLGAEYVKRGFTSAALGLTLVLIFMLFYYRKLGVIAAIGLLFNLVLLMGSMAFIRATLTLPGVAGIILTVGMAVDANILIYERIREEAARGRKPLQSARDGFSNALSTIVDANLTTLITGLILYKFGTGPIKGFATTLCIGIITSMISALMLTRVLVHVALEKGVEDWSMMQFVSKTKINFMGKAKLAGVLSLGLIIAGVSLFASLPTKQKVGIDFLGGTSLTIRTEEPQTADTIRELLSADGNELIGQDNLFTKSKEVKPILNSSDADGFTSFRVVAKTPDADLSSIREDVETWLGSVLQKGPVEVSVTDGRAEGRLYFSGEHKPQDLVTILVGQGIGAATVTQDGESGGTYSFSGTAGAGKTASVLRAQLSRDLESLTDASGQVLTLSSPIGELTSVGAQVVEDLRDKAVVAILLSLFAAVMYIRVRFAEYSYGFAAVIALVHDVLITIGALGLMIWTGAIEAEINLAMIAAFMTIIGYSLNDTIVVFDRIRENLHRVKGSMREIINVSINQTLARTLLTSITTLISVTLLFAFNLGTGNVIEGFAFAMLVGVLVGTYSSMFVATPALLWLEGIRQSRLTDEERAEEAALALEGTAIDEVDAVDN